MKLTYDQRKIFSVLGKKGGRATLKKHGKKQLTEWGKCGGRPRKKGVDKSTGQT